MLNQEFDNFTIFLKSEGYEIIQCNHQHQTDFLMNFLNLGDGKIISVNPMLKEIVKDANIDVKVDIIDIKFEAVIKMFGAVHCTTQVSRRKKKSNELNENTTI